MSSTQTFNNKRKRASSTHHEESATIAIRPRTITTVFISVASSGFESLVDDTLDLVLQFVGKRSYGSYGSINKRCREVFLSKNLPKETFLYGYAPFSMIKEKYDRYDFGGGDGEEQAVVAYNRNDILQWLMLDKEDGWSMVVLFDIAARVGLKTLKRVLNDVGDDFFTFMEINERWNVSYSAARGERLDVLKWLKTKGWLETDDYELFPSAAEEGNVNMLEFLKENKCPLDPEECMLHAARGGSLESIQWLLQNGCSFDHVDSFTIDNAAGKGHLHVIQFFIENGFSIKDIDEDVSYYAAKGGHLHILKWLHDNNRPFNEETFASAALDKKCYSEVAEFNRLEVLEWLKEKGCPRNGGVIVVYHYNYVSSEVKEWLRENGFTLKDKHGNNIDDY